ncbi:MAG: anthranilate phosphoribosyltransferase, partial [Sphingomonadales bacterium]
EVAVVTGNAFTMERVDAGIAGLPHAPIEAIRGDNAKHNAAALKALLMGNPGPYRDAVLFNAAGALTVAGRGADWTERAAMAAEVLDSGAALALLNKWIALAR